MCTWYKNLWHQREGSANGRLRRTKWRNVYVQYMFSRKLQGLLLHATIIKLLTFIFARRYSPSEKKPINSFTQLWNFSDFKPKNKIDITLILSIIAKEKSDRTAKSENLFWFLTTLTAFVIAYIKGTLMQIWKSPSIFKFK